MEDSAHCVSSAHLMNAQKGLEDAQTLHVDATLATRKALISAADMATVRSRLSPELSQRCSDQTVNQFLRAADGNVTQVLHKRSLHGSLKGIIVMQCRHQIRDLYFMTPLK